MTNTANPVAPSSPTTTSGPATTPEEAVRRMREKFPFPFYEGHPFDSHVNIARTVARHLPPGSSVLDFGAGPADKTAVVQLMGYRCTAYDELQDSWHLERDNRQKILKFAEEVGVRYVLATDRNLPFAPESFDMFMIHDVIEHLHDSPRDLFNAVMERVKPGGLMYVTVPNAVNIRKRVDVLRGRTNLPPFGQYYWNPGPWRGHVREYVKDDLAKLAEFMGLEIVELRSVHHMLHKLPKPALPVYKVLTNVFPGWRDTWQLVARRPANWKPKYTLPKEELERLIGYHGYAWE